MTEVPSKQYFERKATETGFLTSNLERVYRIMQILDEINFLDTEGYLMETIMLWRIPNNPKPGFPTA